MVPSKLLLVAKPLNHAIIPMLTTNTRIGFRGKAIKANRGTLELVAQRVGPAATSIHACLVQQSPQLWYDAGINPMAPHTASKPTFLCMCGNWNRNQFRRSPTRTNGSWWYICLVCNLAATEQAYMSGFRDLSGPSVSKNVSHW